MGGRTVTRRAVLGGGSLMAIAVAAGLDLTACSSGGSGSDAEQDSQRRRRAVLSRRQRAVLEAATARLIPGPEDDPAEHEPGAREAGAAEYIVTLLGALGDDPPRVYAGGPFSDRAGSDTNDMAQFLTLDEAVREHWRDRLRELASAYRQGLDRLDALAGGDFAGASPEAQDAALARNPGVDDLPAGSTGFTDLLFQHTIEGCYGAPEYGGNAEGVMWRSIGFPGDVQPRGYDDDQVSESDGPDPYRATGIVADLVDLLTSTAPAAPPPSSGAGGGG